MNIAQFKMDELARLVAGVPGLKGAAAIPYWKGSVTAGDKRTTYYFLCKGKKRLIKGKGFGVTVEYIVSAEEMQRADANTIDRYGIPQLVLMERAALAAKEITGRRWQGIYAEGSRVLIACGNGNNGGDGAALARLLFLSGCDVTVLVSGSREKYSSALRTQMEILKRYLADRRRERGQEEQFWGGSFCARTAGEKITKHNTGKRGGSALTIITDDDWRRGREQKRAQKKGREEERERGTEREECGRMYDLIVDALFGIGLSRRITGIYQEKIEWLNGLGGKKAALDIPSGISAQDGSVLGCAFRTDLTVTFGFLKRGMLLYPGREICGETIVADIGITEESFLGKYPAGITIGRMKLGSLRLSVKRTQNSHKGTYGKVLLFAGSAGAPGAALLAGEAVLRSGAGMLQIVSPPENRELVISRLPEAMYQALDENTDWEKLLGWCDAVVAGPGIGQSNIVMRSLEKILTLMSETELQKPIVLDADGLNLLSSSERLSELVRMYTGQSGVVIMTPHMAEFARLLHCGVPDVQKERMEKIENFCRDTGAVLVSKDAATVVGYAGEEDRTLCDGRGSDDDRISCESQSGSGFADGQDTKDMSFYSRFQYYINQTGNSGMATAGSGDVLSGIMGALAAFTAAGRRGDRERTDEKAAYFQAAYHAVYLHGLAGDLAAAKYGEASMKAGDIITALPELLA